MGTITETVLGSTRIISKPFSPNTGTRKIIEIERKSDGKLVSFLHPKTQHDKTIKGWTFAAGKYTKTLNNADYRGLLAWFHRGKGNKLEVIDLETGEVIHTVLNLPKTDSSYGSAILSFTLSTGSTITEGSSTIVKEGSSTPTPGLHDLTFRVLEDSTGHDWTNTQIIHELDKGRHFYGTSGKGIAESPIAIPGGVVEVAPRTGLSDGDTITYTVHMQDGHKINGKTTDTFTRVLPVGTFAPSSATGGTGTHGHAAYTGTFNDSGFSEIPKGTAAQKQAEFEKITTRVEQYEFADQTGIGGMSLSAVIFVGRHAFASVKSNAPISLPNVETIEDHAFARIKITSLSLPHAKTIGANAFFRAPLTTLSMPNVETIGDRPFERILNEPTTHVVMPSLDRVAVITSSGTIPATPGDHANDDRKKDAIFGLRNWYKITFGWVQADGTTLYDITDRRNLQDGELSFIPDLPTTTVSISAKYNTKAYKDHLFAPGTHANINFVWMAPAPDELTTHLPGKGVLIVPAHQYAGKDFTSIYLPDAVTIGDGAFSGSSNDFTHIYTLPAKFNTPTEKDRIFGPGTWDKISFIWI